MSKKNIIIFVVVILVIIAIFGYAMWSSSNNENKLQNENSQAMQQTNDVSNQMSDNNQNATLNQMDDNGQNTDSNQINGNNQNDITSETQTNAVSETNYEGDWYISEEAYRNAEQIDEILDRREDNLITDAEFEEQMSSSINTNIVELDVDRYSQNQIKFDFTLTSPAPNQREGKLDDMVVNLDRGVGTFTYTDNWGTKGNGTITLKDNQIELKLETTSAAQGALWGVEGIYTFSYHRVDR